MLPFLLRRILPLFVALAGLIAQSPYDLARPALRTFGMQDGLPSGTVYCFARDAKGRLWAGSIDGAAYYNGHDWVTVRMPEASTSQYIRSILASEDGSVWFGTQDGGLWRLLDGRWEHFQTQQGLPSNHVFCVAETQDPQGRLVRWVGTQDGGIAALADGRWRAWGPAEGLPQGTVWRVREIHEPGGARRIWAATEKGICILEKERWRLMGPKDGFPAGDVNDVLTVTGEDGRRSVWACLWKQGMGRWDGRAWTILEAGKGFPGHFPTSTLCTTRTPEGRTILWVGTLNQGLWWLAEGAWHSLGRAQGFSTVGILGLLPVPEGKPTLLMGTRGDGVASLDLGNWRTLDENFGLPGPEVTCFAETADKGAGSAFWIGTTAGLVSFRPGRPAERVPPGVLPSDYTVALLSNSDGLWVATLNGLMRKDASGWRREDCGGLLPPGLVICLLETRSRSGRPALWVGTPRGLLCRVEGRWRLMTRQQGLAPEYVSSLCAIPDASGEPVLWVGTRGGGVCRIAPGAWQATSVTAGFPNGNVYALHSSTGPDGRRWLWAGTLGGGLARLDAGHPTTWEVFSRTSSPALSSNYIQRIEEDRRGRLYLSTSAGVDRLRLDWTRGSPLPAQVDTFTLGDGLPSQNGNLGASFVDSLGRIWIGTSKGAAVLDPGQETLAPDPPSPVLERASVADPERPFSAGQRLGFRDQHLRFEFSLPVIHRKDDTRYQTQLIGLEPEPRPWQAEGYREFPSLSAGSYTFRIWARTFDGRVSGPVDFSFRMAPAPWFHPLALGLYVLAAVAAVVAFLRHRTRQLRARTTALEIAVADRTRIIERQSHALETSNQELQSRNADLKETNDQNVRLITELSTALAEVRTLQGFIPICAYCKKIRDDQGFWEQLEHYISHHSGAQFSHGICPECRDKEFGHLLGGRGPAGPAGGEP